MVISGKLGEALLPSNDLSVHLGGAPVENMAADNANGLGDIIREVAEERKRWNMRW